MSNPIDQTRDELLAAIRTQTNRARSLDPQAGAAALRDLAEAYSSLTFQPLPPLGDLDEPPVDEYRLSTR